MSNKFYNPSKKGTLILAAPRYGTHFLAQVIVDLIPAVSRPWQGIGEHSEIGITKQQFCGIEEELDYFNQQSGYQVVIANDLAAKMWMMTYPGRFDDWHVVRITHDNKVQWFISYWYFLIKHELEFGHHGTSRNVYKQHMDQYGPHTISSDQMMIVLWSLSQTLLNQHISCDEHVDYQELAGLDTNVQWQRNEYLNIELSELFTNSDVIEKLLTNWPKEIPSAIRS